MAFSWEAITAAGITAIMGIVALFRLQEDRKKQADKEAPRHAARSSKGRPASL
jgi:hypothetical protein